MKRILPYFLNSSKGTSPEHATRLLYDGVLAQSLHRTYRKANLLPDPQHLTLNLKPPQTKAAPKSI